MFRWKRMTGVAVVAALALSGCAASDQGGTSEDTTAATLTLGMIRPATTMAAADMSWQNEAPYGQAVYDTLLRAAPDGTPEPWLATEWEYNDDNTVLSMTLRTDVTFSDGTVFNADAAVQNLIRFRDGASQNKGRLAMVSDVIATSDSTIELTLSDVDPSLIDYLAMNAGQMASPASFTAADIQTNPIGSGPYILDVDATVVGTSYVYTKNEDYWAEDTVKYDNLVLSVYEDDTALLNAVKGGQVNASQTRTNTTLKEVEAAGFSVEAQSTNWLGLILFDRGGTTQPALADVRVRQALNYAFDTEALLEAVGSGYGETTNQIWGVNTPGYLKELDSYYSYDPEKAKELLAEAGYADGFTLSQPSAAFLGTTVFALIEQQLADIGITVEYTDTGTNFIAESLTPKFGTIYMQLQSDPTAWQLASLSLASDATWNPYDYQDATVDSLMEVLQYGTPEESLVAAEELNTYVVEQAWFAPWYRIQTSYVTDANTTVVLQSNNSYPYLWNFSPKS